MSNIAQQVSQTNEVFTNSVSLASDSRDCDVHWIEIEFEKNT